MISSRRAAMILLYQQPKVYVSEKMRLLHFENVDGNDHLGDRSCKGINTG